MCLSSNEKKYYFVLIDDEANTEGIQNTETNLKSILTETSLLCELESFISSEQAKDFLEKNRDQIICISYDITNIDDTTFLEDIDLQLQTNTDTGIIILTATKETHEEQLEELKNNYKHFIIIEKPITEESAKTELLNLCKTCFLLKKQMHELIYQVMKSTKSLFTFFYNHRNIIISNEKAGQRYITNVLKESLYDGNFLEEKHQHFEIYSPIHDKNIKLKCGTTQSDQCMDSHIRFGLIVSKKNTEEYFLYASPTCNIHKIKTKKIEYIQLLPLEMKEQPSTNSPNNSESIILLQKSTTNPEKYCHINPTEFSSECIILKKPTDTSSTTDQEYLIKTLSEAEGRTKQGFKIERYSIPTPLSEHLYEIPKYNDPNKWWEINFTKIQNIKVSEFCDRTCQNHYYKEAILIESFAKDIQHKFSSYYGRQGSIDLY